MTKFSGPFLTLFFLFLTSCSTEPDNRSPVLDTQDDLLISVFDTFYVEFNEGLKSFDKSNFESETPLEYFKKNSAVYGFYPETQIPASTKFEPESEISISFSGLKDKSGNSLKANTEISFRTMPYIETDYLPVEVMVEGVPRTLYMNNGETVGADLIADSTHFANHQPITDTFFVSGILENQSRTEFTDNSDTYSILLQGGDCIAITLTGMNEDLDLELKGPKPQNQNLPIPESNFWISRKSDLSKESVYQCIDGTIHEVGVGNNLPLGTYLEYWITVYYKKDPERGDNRPSPYVLSIKKEKAD
jgi:hypothetical protein